MKTEKVRIDLPKISKCHVKPCSNKTDKPISDKFTLVPKYMPQLSQHITQTSWNCVEKTLDIEINETGNFDAFNWFSNINKRVAESQKSSFVDMEHDSLVMTFQDEFGNDLANVKFRGLHLINHSCFMVNNINPMFDANPNFLFHTITIRYTDCETTSCIHEEPESMIVAPQKQNEIVDKEWQDVNVG